MIPSSDVDEAIPMLQGSYCSNSLRKTTSKLSLKRSKSVLILTLRSAFQIPGNLILLCSLFNGALSDYTRWNDWMIVNNKFEGMGKEAAGAQFKVLIGHSSWRKWWKPKNLGQNNLRDGRVQNWAPQEYIISIWCRFVSYSVTCNVMFYKVY
jgi:hypothetical protein